MKYTDSNVVVGDGNDIQITLKLDCIKGLKYPLSVGDVIHISINEKSDFYEVNIARNRYWHNLICDDNQVDLDDFRGCVTLNYIQGLSSLGGVGDIIEIRINNNYYFAEIIDFGQPIGVSFNFVTLSKKYQNLKDNHVEISKMIHQGKKYTLFHGCTQRVGDIICYAIKLKKNCLAFQDNHVRIRRIVSEKGKSNIFDNYKISDTNDLDYWFKLQHLSEINQLLEFTVFKKSQIIEKKEFCSLQHFSSESNQMEEKFRFENKEFNNFIVALLDFNENSSIFEFYSLDDLAQREIYGYLQLISQQLKIINLVGNYISSDYRKLYSNSPKQMLIKHVHHEIVNADGNKEFRLFEVVDKTYNGMYSFGDSKDRKKNFINNLMNIMRLIDTLFRLLFIGYKKVEVIHIQQAMPIMIAITNVCNRYTQYLNRAKGSKPSNIQGDSYSEKHEFAIRKKVQELLAENSHQEIVKKIMIWEFKSHGYQKITSCKRSRDKGICAESYYSKSLKTKSHRYRYISKLVTSVINQQRSI